jgi:uncharacterized membrane protein
MANGLVETFSACKCLFKACRHLFWGEMVIPQQSQVRFEWVVKPNRSLTAKGRNLWLMLIAISALPATIGALAIGAWPILPFAGLEVALVWLAFRVIAGHDCDYEVLQVDDRQFAWECCSGGEVQRLQGYPAWAKVQVDRTKRHCRLRLSYAGKSVVLGSFATDKRREQLLAQMGRFFPAAT